MATSVHFNHAVKTEQNLVEDLIVESLRMYGHNCFYLPRNIINENTILGDAADSKFEDAYEVEMYLEGNEGFEGEGDLFTKFGVEIRDEATFIVARKRWSQVIASGSNVITVLRPKEGDLIWLSLSNKLFEIMHVEHESPFYQLSNLPTYKMRCQLFEYSGEDLDTGIADVNSIQSDFGYRVSLTMDSAGAGYTIGENVTQTFTSGTILTGEVAAWSDSDNILHLVNFGANDGAFHLPVTGRQVRGAISNNLATPSVVAESLEQNKTEQNNVFETTNDVMSFLDFSETNPFGDVQ